MLRLASDERLVSLVRAGSQPAFEVIYDRHHRAILSFCRHMLGNREEGEDALQHTFIAAYRDLSRSEKAIQLRPWLYAIARNRCLSILRGRRERPLEEMDEPVTAGLSAEVEHRAELRDMVADIAQLPDDQREAIVLAELGDLSHEDIGRILDCPASKVKALVFQARTSLHASRDARETSCEEVREMLANLSGGSLRRSTLRRHVKACDGCRAFEKEVGRQRKAMAAVLPVVPTLGLKASALAAVFGGGTKAAGIAGVSGATGLATGTGAVATTAAGGTAVATGSAVVAKVLIVAAVATGGAAGVKSVTHDSNPATPKPGTTGAPAPASAPPAAVAPQQTGEQSDSASSKGTKGKRTRKRPHGNRRGKTDRGKAFAGTRGKKNGRNGTQPSATKPAAGKPSKTDAAPRKTPKAKTRAAKPKQGKRPAPKPARTPRPQPTSAPKPARTPKPAASQQPADTGQDGASGADPGSDPTP